MIDHVAFAADLRRFRGELDLREMAKDLGITASTLSRAENAKVVDLKTYAILCVVMEVSLDTYVTEYNKTFTQRLDTLEARLKKLESR